MTYIPLNEPTKRDVWDVGKSYFHGQDKPLILRLSKYNQDLSICILTTLTENYGLTQFCSPQITKSRYNKNRLFPYSNDECMATGSLQVNRDIIVATRKQYLLERKHVTPMDAIMALAAMQSRPRYVLNMMSDREKVTVIGQIRLQETYDPVLAALNYIRAGTDAVSYFTDHTIYNRDLDDMLMISRGIRKHPVVSHNYVFDEYGVIAARASGASALVGYASLLSAPKLRGVISITQRYKMTAILQISSMAHLEHIYELSPHVVSIGDPENQDVESAARLFEEFKPHIPFYCRTMLSNTLSTLDEVEFAINAGVDAVLVSDEVYATSRKLKHMHQLVNFE